MQRLIWFYCDFYGHRHCHFPWRSNSQEAIQLRHRVSKLLDYYSLFRDDFPEIGYDIYLKLFVGCLSCLEQRLKTLESLGKDVWDVVTFVSEIFQLAKREQRENSPPLRKFSPSSGRYWKIPPFFSWKKFSSPDWPTEISIRSTSSWNYWQSSTFSLRNKIKSHWFQEKWSNRRHLPHHHPAAVANEELCCPFVLFVV